MDAMDVNWCLTCQRHIDVEGSAPYCSRECYASDRPSSSSLSPHFRPLEYDAYAESISELDGCEACSQSRDNDACTEQSRWIGKGMAGIHAWAQNVPPGPPAAEVVSVADLRPPVLLQQARRPVPPSVCVTQSVSAAPEPAQPPHEPVPALSRSSRCPTDASALTTPCSSVSLATPASNACAFPISAQAGLISTLTAQLRSWAAASHKGSPRSHTITRPADAPAPCVVLPADGASDGASCYSDVKESYGHPEKFAPAAADCWEALLSDDRPGLRMRGRRSARCVS
ncbi:hypothetical protein WOLCODRAFT_138990 [Wolfiporia cocos MD-104 SS10]|uniref:Uncharacterized protein n=1 Tax=Wolfiporia cocos (strain MD-104) TaxID=742152 RepID=A0A2H3JZS6_WOLCO|nr:hypothetical protein WOLCODRAFT_138990 [Wolfiporia cocos MD-104 SS10]